MDRLQRRFLYIAALITATFVFGTTGFILVEGYPPFDAFYMTLITITTVGYSEIHPLSNAGRVFNSILLLVGVTTLFAAIGAIAQTTIEREFGDALHKRRNKRMIANLKDHFIVCGFGRVGRGASEELKRAGVPFVVVDRNPDRVESAMALNMLAVLADSTQDETLREAGIERARGLVSALATDADNLFVVLSARTLNQKLYVAVRAAEEGSEEKMRRAGADAVIAPYAITGHRLAQALLRPHVVQFLDFTSGLGPDVGIEQVRVAERSDFVSRSMKDTQIRKELGAIVLAIRSRSGEMLFNPSADTVISAGDYLIVMGRPEHLRRLEELAAGSGALGTLPKPQRQS
jgi:voltage-gated potassium channel